MNTYPNFLFYSINNHKKEKLRIDYNNLYYNIIDHNPVKNYIKNQNIMKIKPKKNVQWSCITEFGETYSKYEYDRTIDSLQITQNINEICAEKQAERQRILISNKSMTNLFMPFTY